MNGSLRDAQAPSYRECLLPSAARTSSIIQVTPAKKITFFKRGDPRFSGVRLAVHQRAFKSFSALMDELSQRMPLSFGVRSVTTPRGLHCLSTLEQLEDGGCYLCSDKKPPQTPIGPGRQQERALTTQPLGDSESRSEDAGTPSSWKGPRVSRRIMLVKNTNPRFQRTVLLSHRNTRSLPAFLSKASDLLHFPVKQVFTPSGKKVDSLQGLLHGPLVLVCAGHESFRPPVIEESRRNGTETSSGLTSRNKNGSWGLKAKQSIIHSRSKSGNRSRRFSTMSERSGLSEAPVSLPHTCMSSALHKHFQDTPAHIGPLVADDDFEKKVHMNEDGSLSVEMKVRFHLPSEDTLLWSTGIRRASTLTTTSGGHPVLGEVDALHCVCEGSSEDFSESGVLGQRACESQGEEALNQSQQTGLGYEIWTNPMYRSEGEEMDFWRKDQLTQNCTRASWSQGAASGKRTSKTSVNSTSKDRPTAGSEPNIPYCPQTLEDSVGSFRKHHASKAASKRGAEEEAGCTPETGRSPTLEPNPCSKEAGEGSREQLVQEEGSEEEPSQGCLNPRPCALPDSSDARCHKKANEKGGPCRGCINRRRPVTSQQEHAQESSSSHPALSPSSLGTADLQAEANEQDAGIHKAEEGSVMRLTVALCHSGSVDGEGCSSSLSSYASAQRMRRKQKSQASAVPLPNASGSCDSSQRNHHRKHHQRDGHYPLDSPATKQILSPANRGRACSDDLAPSSPESSSRVSKQASRDPGSPSCGSLRSQYLPGIHSATVTPVSNSEPPKTDSASSFYPSHSTSAETEGDPGHRMSSPAPTPSSTSDSVSAHVRADHLDKKAGGSIPKLSSPLARPVKRPNRVKSDDRQGSHCSHIDTSLVCGIHSSKIQTLWASQSQGRPRSTSGACLVCSRYCPTPPSADPSSKKHSSSSSSNSDVYRAADWGPGEGEQGERRFDGLSSLPLGSKSGATGGTVRTMMRSSPCPSSSFGPSPSPSPRGMSQWKIAGEEVSLEEQEEDGGMMPSALPRISPEAVICDWLSQIPEEPILMKYEMMDETSNVTEDDSQCTQEDPTDKHSEIGPEESAQAEEQPLEGETSETPELDGAPATDGASLKLEEDSSQKGAPRGVSETCEEVRASERTTVDHGVCKDILTSSIPASIHIMKTLISSKQGRPRSLPEVSDVVGRRLSDSACTLVTSLARLHFFDEDLGSPVSRVRFTDSPRFQMLLATLQSLWPQCDKLDLGLQEPKSGQALPGSVSHPVTEDFTPTSSSGVDVSSGSVGSGEGNAPCPVDCTPSPERVQMPLEMVQSTASHQKPDSSTSENAEELENQHQSCPAASSDSQAWACTTSQDKAGENEGEGQMEDNSPEQSVENTVQENLKVEQIQELDKELRKDHGSEEEFPEEERVPEQELPGDDTEDGEGTQEGTGMPEEDAGRDPDSEEDLYPAGLSGKTTGPSRNPSEGDAQTSEHLSSRAVEPSLKKPSRSAEAASEQTQATATQRAGDRSSSTAPRPPRDADPIWAFSLLKKMEKAFMAHLASATVALRARWGLLDHDLLDQLVAELHQDVGRRLQDSVKKEFGKIQSRAGGKEPRPPREALRRETSLQAEQRRRRLQGLRNLSAFAERTRTQGLLSLTLEDEPSLSAGLDTGLDGQADGEEFCPCKTCVRKKVSGASPSRGPVGAGSAPLVQSYDLRQILQKRKDGGANGGAPAGDQEQVGLGQLQEHPSRTGSVQGAEGGLEPGLGPSSQVDSGEEEEGSQKLSEAGDPELGEAEGAGSQEGEEDPAAQTRDADIEDENDRKGERPEQGVSETEENVIEGPGSEDTLMSESSGGEDGDPGGEGKTADAGQFPEAEGQGQAESGSEQEEGRLSVSPGEASENCTPDQEEKLPCSPGPGDDTPHQEPVPQTGISSFIMSSLGNCSQVSQKGSEEEDSNGDTGSFADEPTEVTHPEKNVTGMSPDSSTSGPEEACSGPKTPDQKVDEDSALADGKVVKSLTFTNMVNKTGEFGQDDFDF